MDETTWLTPPSTKILLGGVLKPRAKSLYLVALILMVIAPILVSSTIETRPHTIENKLGEYTQDNRGIRLDAIKGYALYFDGEDDYLEIPDITNLGLPNGSQPGTIMAWIKLLKKPNQWRHTYAFAVSYGDCSCGEARFIGFKQYDETHVYVYGGGYCSDYDVWYLVPLDKVYGRWIHIALVYDGETLKLYLNGELVAQKQVKLYTDTDEEPLRIGRQINYNPEYFPGIIDEVRIYNRELTQQEIQSIIIGNDLRENLVLHFSFDNIRPGDTIVEPDFGKGKAIVHGCPEITPRLNYKILWYESFPRLKPLMINGINPLYTHTRGVTNILPSNWSDYDVLVLEKPIPYDIREFKGQLLVTIGHIPLTITEDMGRKETIIAIVGDTENDIGSFLETSLPNITIVAFNNYRELLYTLKNGSTYNLVIINYWGIEPTENDVLELLTTLDKLDIPLILLDTYSSGYGAYYLYMYRETLWRHSYPAPSLRDTDYDDSTYVVIDKKTYHPILNDIGDSIEIGVYDYDDIDYAYYKFPQGNVSVIATIRETDEGTMGVSIAEWTAPSGEKWLFFSIGASCSYDQMYTMSGDDNKYNSVFKQLILNAINYTIFTSLSLEYIEYIKT